MLFRIALVAALSSGGLACAAETGVQLVTDPAAMASCQRLGEVKGASAWGGMLTNVAYSRALGQLKKRAAKLGGTHVQLLNASSGWSGSNMLGVVFRCEAQGRASRPG